MNYKHGFYGIVEHRIWRGILARCYNSKHQNFAAYGGRGIAVCERWRSSFLAFFDDVGPRPTGRHSIDRINNDGHYEPRNVRWATPKEQANNRRKRHLTNTIKERRPWEAFGISRRTWYDWGKPDPNDPWELVNATKAAISRAKD